LETANSDEPVLREVMGGLSEEQVAVEEERDGKTDGTWINFGPVMCVGGITNTDWEFETGFWPVEGLAALTTSGKVKLHLAFETPFVGWYVRNATQLSTGQVVFQLGEDQVCILEPESRKVARVTFGRGPIVVVQMPRAAVP
jgi:hypothetical protein